MQGVHLLLTVATLAVCLTSSHAHRRPWGHRSRGHRSEVRSHDEPRRRNSHWMDNFHRMFGGRRRHVLSGTNPFFNLDVTWGGLAAGLEKPWWEGPNVCLSESEQHDNSSSTHQLLRHFMSTSESCDQSDTAYKCKVTQNTFEGRREVTTIQQCCHGYSRQKGDFGCPTRETMDNLLTTLEARGLTDFTQALRLLDIEGLLEKDNLTVFAPVNGAFDLNNNIMPGNVDVVVGDAPGVVSVSKSVTEAAVTSLQDLVLAHMVEGVLPSVSLEDEELVVSENVIETTIRINYFNTRGTQTMMANCVPVVSRDISATNGVLHTVAQALVPVSLSLLELVKRREDLSTLKTVLAMADYVATLDKSASLTLLAPTNSAFDKMDTRLRERLMAGDNACVQKVLQNLLLPNVICTGALSGENQTPNQLRRLVNLTTTPDGKMFADGAQMVQTDVMATNGVMHLIDQVLVPQEAMHYLEVLSQQGLTEVVDLIEKAGLDKTLHNYDNVTVFAPTNQAIQSLPESVKSQLKDKEFLKDLLTYHVTQGLHNVHRLHDNVMLPAMSGSDVRINTYQASPFHRHDHIKTLQCVPLTRLGVQACHSNIYTIDKVLLPPTGNVVDVLALDKRFSRLVGLVKKAGVADMLQGEGPYTVFAPNNKAFEKMDKKTLEELETDPEELTALIKRHIFQNALCCAGIRRSSWFYHPQVRVMSGELLKLHKRGEELISVGGARLVTCDRTATNGVVQELDDVIPTTMSRDLGRLARHFDSMFG